MAHDSRPSWNVCQGRLFVNTGNTDKRTESDKPQFEMQHVYVKDISFESPYAPEIFQQKWEPKVSIDLNQEHKILSQEAHEVALMMTVTVKLGDKEAYIAEVKQAGIFTVRNFSNDQLDHFLQVFCPDLLYPYLRESISNLVIKGGFAPLYVAPVNFEALFRKKKAEQA
ncbi:MAG: protein-export chaperone SecB [Oligoflexales bacterium]|nr:protein-export chaperone SecB [Oligoflexales bacterium]